MDHAGRILVAVVVAVIAAVHDGARAQDVVNAQRTYERPLSGDERVVPISRTPEGFTLGASKADISYQIRTRWGLDYAALNVRGGQEVENAARAFVAAERARIRARSLQTPRGY